MVADYITKCMQRSLVRVPGSGRDQGVTAVATVFDLGKVSPLAASIPINPNVPAIIRGLRVCAVPSTSSVVTDKLATTKVLASLQCESANSTRRPRPEAGGDDARQESKRLRLEVSSPSTGGGSSSHSRVTAVNVHSNQPQTAAVCVGQGGSASITARRVATGRRVLSRLSVSHKGLVLQQKQNCQQESKLLNNIHKNLEDLQQERIRLQEENKVLMQNLSRYMQLCRARGISPPSQPQPWK